MTYADGLPHLIEICGDDCEKPCVGYRIGHLLTCPEPLTRCPYQQLKIVEVAPVLPPGRYELHLDAASGAGWASATEYQPPEQIYLPPGWTHLTGNVPVRVDRAKDWAQNRRPLPGRNAAKFLREAASAGFIDESDAAEYLERHERLCIEEAKGSDAFQCNTCNGAPPAGFTCQNCGGGSQ